MAAEGRGRLGVRLGPVAAIAGPVMVEAEAPGGDSEPGGEPRAAVGLEGTETMEIAFAQLLEDVAVSLHRLVVAAAEGAGHAEEQPGMPGDELLPRRLASCRVRRVQEYTQFERCHVVHGLAAVREGSTPKLPPRQGDGKAGSGGPTVQPPNRPTAYGKIPPCS